MSRLLIIALCAVLFVGCESANSAIQSFTRPDIINWDYVDNLPNAPFSNRKISVYQADVAISNVGDKEIVLLATTSDNSVAYVLEQEQQDVVTTEEMKNAWIVYLNDHLILLSEDGEQKIRFSLAGKPINSQVINDGISYSKVYEGFGLARYMQQQPVTVRDLSTATSYLEARRKVGK